MSNSQMLSVRIPAEDIEKLDQLAALQGRSRSQLIQEALAELVIKDAALRRVECARLKKMLKSAIDEQCEIIEQGASFADNNRSF